MSAAGGYKEFLTTALPLIISTGAWALQNFVNRVFLAWFNQDAYAASLPAGLLSFTIMSIFIGSIAYIDVFVSQYNGKGEYKSIGPSVWQSFYLSFFAAAVLIVISLFSESIFAVSGHAPSVIAEEVKYFRLLCLGSFFAFAPYALSGFYAGRERTGVILIVNIIGLTTATVFDYLLIFGNFGFPRLGIEGAALSSIIGSFFMLIIFMVMILSKKNHLRYNTRKLKPDFAFIKRLLRFGFPNGVQFFFDMAAFTFFVIIIGSAGKEIQSATNIVMNINQLIFMPLVGCGITTSIMVGNYLGQNNPELSARSVRTALKVVYAYIAVVLLLIVFCPYIFIFPFAKGSEAELVTEMYHLIVTLLKFVAIYTLFDPASVIFSSALKGAGDTAFIMKVLSFLAIFAAGVPIYLAMRVFNLSFYIGWAIFVLYAILLAVVFFLRYRGGKWKSMRVIEP